MRWEDLFADLEARWAASEDAEFAAEVSDRTRSEIGRVTLVDRLRGGRGRSLRLHLLGGTVLEGVLESVGPDWLLVADDRGAGGEVLVVVAALAAVRGLGRATTESEPAGSAVSRLGLRHALRQVARDRLPVVLTLRDATGVVGTVDRVGADHLELTEHPASDLRRTRDVSTARLLPYAALACVRLNRAV